MDANTKTPAAETLTAAAVAALRYAAGECVETPNYSRASDELVKAGLLDADTGALTPDGWDVYRSAPARILGRAC